MSKLINIDVNSTTYRDMVAEVLPRGPIWDLSNPGVGGMAGGLGVEAVRFHRRLYDLMLEAYPSTADELLAEWEEVFGLPLCTEPDTDDGRRVALAGRVAAQGGQSRAYYIDLAWSVLEADGEFSRVDDPSGVWIEEEPYGSPFEAWGGSAWDLLGGSGARHYWTMHLPSAVGATKRAIIECLLCKYKPAHTVLLRLNDLRHYYSTPGGASDYAEASTNVAARLIFPGGSIGTFTVLMWAQQPTSSGLSLWTCGTWGDDFYESGRDGPSRLNHEVGVYDASFTASALSFTTPDTDEWFFQAETCDGSTIRAYVNGTEADNAAVAGTFTAQDVLALFCARADNYFVGGSEGSLRNIAIFDRALTADEIAELYAAGMHHNYANRHGAGWAGETPVVYWRTKPVAGAVPNSGSGGVCALTLGGDVTATEEEAEITCETPGEPAADHYYYRLSSASLAQLAASATPMNDDNVGGFFCWLRIVSGWAQIAETHDGTQQWFLNVEPGAEEWDFDDVTFTPPELATDEWFAVAIPNVGSELGLYFNGAAVSLPGVADGFVRGNGRIYTEDGVFEVLDPCYVDGVVVTTDHIAAHAARGPGADPLLDDGDWDIGGDVIALWRDNIVEGEVANRRALAHPLVVTGGVQALPFEEEE